MARKLLILLAVCAALAGSWFFWSELRSARIARRVDELGKDLETDIRDWEARDRSRPPLFEPAVEGTAWEHYRQAERIRAELEERHYAGEIDPVLENWEGFRGPFPASLPAPVVRWIESFGPALFAVRNGACTTRTGVADDLRVGDLTRDEEEYSLHSHAVALFCRFSDLLRYRAAACLGAGDAEAAVTWLLVRERLAFDLAVGGTSVHGFSGRLDAGHVRADLGRLIGGGLLPTGEVDRAAGLPPPRRPGWLALEADFLQAQVDLMRTARGDLEWLKELGSVETRLQEVAFSFVAPDSGDALDTWVRLRAEFPVWRAAGPGEDDASFGSVAREIRGTLDDPPLLWQLFAGGLETRLELTLSHLPGPDEQHEMLQLNIALFRYRQRNGKDPETIEEIRPEGVRKTTSLGAWGWRESEHAPRRWIERGTLADEARRERETEDLVRELSAGD